MFMESFSFEIPFHNEDIFFIEIGSPEVYATISYVAGDNKKYSNIYCGTPVHIHCLCEYVFYNEKMTVLKYIPIRCM